MTFCQILYLYPSGHLGWPIGLPGILLKEDHPKTIKAKNKITIRKAYDGQMTG